MKTDETSTDWQSRLVKHGLVELRRLAAATPLRPRARRFLFLRHGETEGNAKRIYQSVETPLNAVGLGQAQRAAEYLRALPVQRIVASDMRRAWQTAEAAIAIVRAPVTAESRLRERWFGDLVGQSSRDLDWRIEPPNGETLRDFILRTQDGLNHALDTEESTLVVSHGGPLYVLVYSLGAELLERHIANATPLLFEFEVHSGRWIISNVAPEHVTAGYRATTD
ncbi:MAG: histidine phosphatase family protein [Betaproteobacteria bacterium]|nr:MAG: histidine phosphatase family protein [Betaproteobacteria bacterium]